MRERRVRRLSRIHRGLFRASGGAIGHRLVGNDMLLLTTTGRHTGLPHTVPLLYLRAGDRLVVIASFGGRSRHPAWYLNLLADPAVVIRTREGTFPARASTATPGERSFWWAKVVAAYHAYDTYQRRTDREIPVVFLDRVDIV